MGTPIPPPIVVPSVPAGVLCTHCWTADTPESVTVNLSGILDPLGRPSAVNGERVLQQLAGTPCMFQVVDAAIVYTLIYLATTTRFEILVSITGIIWVGFSSVACSVFLPYLPTQILTGGSALVTLPEVT